ncbi:MAG: hypothetical protein OEZ14_03685 [Acidimicrobiia bacterium]|nr:hypothetical protein [Acidimicrobiia bacterium]
MAVDDRTRLNLHRKLETVLGPNDADTLMAHLPPVTWHDVATKADLGTLGAEVRTEIAGVRTEIAGVRTEISRAIDRQTRWMVTFAMTWSAFVVSAVRLLF